MTIFEKIATGQIPAEIVHSTPDFIAFHDAHPQAPIHVLIVPRRPITRIGEAQPADAHLLGEMLLAAQIIATKLGVATSGFRLVINRFQDPFRQTQAHLGVREFGQGEGVISHELFLISLGRLRGLEGL